MRHLTVCSRGTGLLFERGDFRTLLSVCLDESLLKDLLQGPNLGPVNALF